MRSGAMVVAAGLVLALAGCVPSTPYGTDSPESVATPVFTSDAAALKAAETAYAAYLRVSDQIANDGGKDPERFAEVVTKRWLPTELASAGQLSKSGRHQVGQTSFSALKLEQVAQPDASVQLTAHTCLDLTGTQIVDGAGNDVTPATRNPHLSVEVSFESDPNAAKRLLVDSNEPWSGPSFC